MIYWAHNTGLIVDNFASFAYELNQVMENYKTKQEISGQTLFELKLIGFNSENLLNVFKLRTEIPYYHIKYFETYSMFASKIDILDMDSVRFSFDSKIEDLQKHKNLQNKLKFLRNGQCRWLYLKHINLVPYVELIGVCGKVHFYGPNNFSIEFFIDSNYIASKIKQMLIFCVNEIRNKVTNYKTCLVDTNYLTSEEKEFFMVKNTTIANESDYTKFNKLCLLINVSLKTTCIDSKSKKEFTINPNDKLVIWTHFLEFNQNEIINESRFVMR